MTRIRLREEIQRSLMMEWPRFQERHPRLSAILDHDLMAEQAMQSLDDDDEFQHAMADATAERLGAEVLSGVVLQFIQKWLRALV